MKHVKMKLIFTKKCKDEIAFSAKHTCNIMYHNNFKIKIYSGHGLT